MVTKVNGQVTSASLPVVLRASTPCKVEAHTVIFFGVVLNLALVVLILAGVLLLLLE